MAHLQAVVLGSTIAASADDAATKTNLDFPISMATLPSIDVALRGKLCDCFDLVNGRIVSDKTLTLLKKPFINATDLALKGDTVKGHGFFFYPPLSKFETDLMMGHPGHGCQQVMFDMKNRIAFAYVTNGLKLGVHELCRNYARLQKTLYEVLDTLA
ncbi:hypothetical protein OSTOST_16179, partial [Ostertagia ostertagi]